MREHACKLSLSSSELSWMAQEAALDLTYQFSVSNHLTIDTKSQMPLWSTEHMTMEQPNT